MFKDDANLNMKPKKMGERDLAQPNIIGLTKTMINIEVISRQSGNNTGL
jgi:hypothetical protein